MDYSLFAVLRGMSADYCASKWGSEYLNKICFTTMKFSIICLKC